MMRVIRGWSRPGKPDYSHWLYWVDEHGDLYWDDSGYESMCKRIIWHMDECMRYLDYVAIYDGKLGNRIWDYCDLVRGHMVQARLYLNLLKTVNPD